ncbi:hypothetical protein ED733_003049 [Metarhizium rileyi]|uniref:FAD-binding PCMH-type domain-containing protein n=1 Tax=Metarhizium rileyi (strain RCEF 4871) TaxID=1649241 RepID=A0A5C6G2L3_METRR|nr:hypothetical protein ED733_003049 [Metarhizium rileyi]
MKALIAALFALAVTAVAAAPFCRCMPGEPCWPTLSDWNQLNKTVGGRLIKTVPLGAPCHGDSFDQNRCDYLRSEWLSPGIHMNDSSSIMSPFFANRSCDPFTDRSLPCTIGNYAVYTVDVEDARDVVAAVRFANRHNIRFVVRHTGHDHHGRSTGAGALAVWTHRLKDISFKDWSSAKFEGPAMTVGAGVLGYEAMEAARERNLIVVTAECPTVSLAGGFSQGGGRSPLASAYGFAADNTLEFTVVTADGEIRTARQTGADKDLFWALSGGGAGNWGVVLSTTYRVHPEALVGGATLAFNTSSNTRAEFLLAIEKFHRLLVFMADHATVKYTFGVDYFRIAPMTGYNKTAEDLAEVLRPFMGYLNSRKMIFTVNFTQHATYYEHFDHYFGPLPFGNTQVGMAQYGSRLFHRYMLRAGNPPRITKYSRRIVDQGVTWHGYGLNVHPFAQMSANSVNKIWRQSTIHAVFTTPWSYDPDHWDKMLENQDLMSYRVLPSIRLITMDSGAYLSEGDYRQFEYQVEFYGCYYIRLSKIKKAYDPKGLFWSVNSVGSEYWELDDNQRLCRVIPKPPPPPHFVK